MEEKNKNLTGKIIANIITSIRIIGAIILLFIKPFNWLFFVLYTVCGLSDALDGFIARATNGVSELGSVLDSIADLAFYSAMIIKVMPELYRVLPRIIWLFVCIVLLVRLASYIVAYFKYHVFSAMHTYGNKITGFSVFLIPYVIKTAAITVYCSVTCVIGFLASLEELIIHIRSKEYDPKRKCILQKRQDIVKN